MRSFATGLCIRYGSATVRDRSGTASTAFSTLPCPIGQMQSPTATMLCYSLICVFGKIGRIFSRFAPWNYRGQAHIGSPKFRAHFCLEVRPLLPGSSFFLWSWRSMSLGLVRPLGHFLLTRRLTGARRFQKAFLVSFQISRLRFVSSVIARTGLPVNTLRI